MLYPISKKVFVYKAYKNPPTEFFLWNSKTAITDQIIFLISLKWNYLIKNSPITQLKNNSKKTNNYYGFYSIQFHMA